MIVIGFALHIGLLPLFIVSGLVLPWPVVAGLIAVWVVLLIAALTRRRQPVSVMSAPALALVVWVAVLVVGGGVFGWTA